MNKGFAQVYILITLLIAGGLAGAYFLGKTSNNQNVAPAVLQPVKSEVSPTPFNLLPQVTENNENLTPELQKQIIPLDETTNWKTYTDQTFPYAIQYPQTWSLEIPEYTLDIPTIRLRLRINQQNRAYHTELFIGDSFVYSTSGALCANTSCEKAGSLALQIEEEKINTPILKIINLPNMLPAYRMQFILPVKFAGKSSKLVPTITATYGTDEEKAEIIKILSTFRSTN